MSGLEDELGKRVYKILTWNGVAALIVMILLLAFSCAVNATPIYTQHDSDEKVQYSWQYEDFSHNGMRHNYQYGDKDYSYQWSGQHEEQWQDSHQTTTVPEPSSLTLLMLGLTFFFIISYSRKKHVLLRK
jgi:hypothetical protein